MTLGDGPEELAVPIRVLVANLSGVLGELVMQVIQQQPDMTLVGQVQGQVELLMTVGSVVDVLVLGAMQTYPPPGICSHLLSEFPALRIVVLATSGDRGAMYWLGLRHRRLRTISPATLLRSVRRVHAMNPSA